MTILVSAWLEGFSDNRGAAIPLVTTGRWFYTVNHLHLCLLYIPASSDARKCRIQCNGIVAIALSVAEIVHVLTLRDSHGKHDNSFLS
jgi:hypothetical protein